MGSDKWPANIRPDDHSRAACQRRVQHFETMYRLNPKGFRQPSKNNSATKSRAVWTWTRRMSEMAYG